MRRRDVLAVAALTVIGMVGVVHAADADITGTWKYEVSFNDNKFEQTLKLKHADGKVTGTLVGRNNMEFTVDDGKIKDGEVTFSVTREFNGNKRTSKYKGKLDGDSIKGKIEFERDGSTSSIDWDAKRQK